MLKPKTWIALVVILLLVNITTLAFLWFQYKRHAVPPQGASTKDFIIREVGLTAKQQLQYDSLRKLHHKAISTLNTDDRRLHDQMFEYIGASNIDTIMLDSMALQMSQVEVKKQKITLYHFRELRKILTSEQQAKFDKILSEAIKLINRPAQHNGGRMPAPGGHSARPEDHDRPPPPAGEFEPHPPDGDGPPLNEEGPPQPNEK